MTKKISDLAYSSIAFEFYLNCEVLMEDSESTAEL